MQKVIIFVDGSNFYHGIKKEIANPALWVDYLQLFQILAEDRQLKHIYYYSSPVNRDAFGEQAYQNQQKFFSRIKKCRDLTLKLGRLEKRIKDGVTTFVEKGVDVSIAVDMISMAYENRFDTAILVSGDGDFAVAISEVQKLGKVVEVAYPPSSRLFHLKQVCNRFIPIDKTILDKCSQPFDSTKR